MTLISQISEIKKKISGQILFNEELSKYSWFNLGGPAKVIFKPKNLNELSFFLKSLKGNNKIKVLGGGSNTLIRDNGFDGIMPSSTASSNAPLSGVKRPERVLGLTFISETQSRTLDQVRSTRRISAIDESFTWPSIM